MIKKMKWLAVLAIGLMPLMASTSWAAFTSVSSTTLTAGVTLTQAGATAMTATLRNISNNAVAGSIAWSDVVLPDTQWKSADQYIELVSTLTATNGGIQAYTDNTSYTGTGIAAGLVNTGATSVTPLSMAWAVKDTVLLATQAVALASDPNQVGVYNGWFFFKDPNSNDDPNTVGLEYLVPGEEYATVKDINGMHFGPGPGEYAGTSSPDYIYMEANWTAAVTPATYSGNVVVEAFTE